MNIADSAVLMEQKNGSVMSNNMKRMFFSRDNGLQSQASLFAKSGIFFDFMLTNTEKRDRVIEVMDAEGLSE